MRQGSRGEYRREYRGGYRGGYRLAALAVALYVAGVLLWVREDRRSQGEVFPPGSVLNTGDRGLSLAYAYLRERSGSRVEPLRTRVGTGTVPARGVVFRVLPVNFELENLSPAEEAWVRGGGRLVLGSASPRPDGEKMRRIEARKVFPVWPGVRRVLPPVQRPLRTLNTTPGSHAVLLAGDEPVLLRVPLGAGEVFLLSCPEVLQNRHLARGDHLALLEALAGVPERRPVLFDERMHGLADRPGVAETLADWGLGPWMLLALLTAGAAFWRASARLGPPAREDRDTRSDAIELLDSLADLYDRALHRGDAIRLYHESFVRTLALETSLRGPALEARARDLLDGLAPPAPGEDLPRDRFDRALRTINQAFRRLHDGKR